MAIFSHQAVNQHDEGTAENTHDCQFEGSFSQDISLLYSSQSQHAPYLLLQNKRIRVNHVKDFKNEKLCFSGAVCQASLCLWGPLDQTLQWDKLSLTTPAWVWSSPERSLALSRITKDRLPNWSSSLRYFKRWDECGHKSLANVHPSEAVQELFIQPAVSTRIEDDGCRGWALCCCTWQAVFALAHAPQCI